MNKSIIEHREYSSSDESLKSVDSIIPTEYDVVLPESTIISLKPPDEPTGEHIDMLTDGPQFKQTNDLTTSGE